MANSKVSITEWEKSLMAKNPNFVNAWKEEFEEVMNILKNSNNALVKTFNGRFNIATWSQYITLDALNREDWPNGIDRNSIYLIFKIDQITKKVEIHSAGHIWISPQDKELYSRDRYLAMHSMLNVTKRNGGKVMRKSTYKSAQDLADKILKAFDNIMEQVIDYTGGYPYKEGIKALKTAA